ncbi:MAG: SGNH/GDSL hydrolase family protein [Verrucomicrobia bacterium]|nr:SGNH/GDSL hydrolase family protein [Verrucomicrobiota bacterium]
MLWNSPALTGDTLFFVQAPGAAHASARLLLIPKATPRLMRATGDVAYEADRDFTWQRGTREIVLTPGSRIPFRTHAEILPPPGSPHSIGESRDGTSHLIYAEGHFFHDQQVVASYEAVESWTGPIPAADPTGLARTLARLRAKQPLKIVLLGDSISTGANASGPMGAPPHQPAWQDLLVTALRERFGAPVSLTNLAVGGTVAPWGIEQLPAAIAGAPDLFIIAFGMNDASGRRPPAEYRELIHQMAATMQATRPACDVIAVATMTGNSDWKYAAPHLYPLYRDELLTLRAPGLAVADVTSLWAWVVERKRFLDLAGNGVNHPNDFGHRLYADVLLALFG